MYQKKIKINRFFIFKVGKTMWLKNEIEINKVTAISGSGPGYIFLLLMLLKKLLYNLD